MRGQRLSGDEMTKIKGLRDIQTLGGLAHGGVTGTRAQIVNKLAHLEHAKDQLERELEIWTTNQKRVGSRLQLVRQRIGLLQRALEKMDPSAKRDAPSPDQEASDDSREAGTAWREVTLEY